MKIRNGFVSNSSSSSFVLAIKKWNRCEHCGRADINLLDILSIYGESEETHILARGAEEVEKWIKEKLIDWETPPNSKEWKAAKALVTRAKNLEKEGCCVGAVEISYHDEAIQNIFEEGKRSGSITVLYGLE